ncbi:APC family permease [Amycolatopsis palatopharyngis]|uniref:APC family permease n=1 Tax=Amycolatopsis palatopharyngis TaxID=187982 RepID=UPI000E22D6D8|nr:APC family permease [Amycolatopsis palatopharyngis]
MSSQNNDLVAKLTLPSVVLIGVAYMAPVIVVTTFGVIASTTDGSAPLAYIFTTVAMLLTALSYSKMARAFPKSGSVYTYARRMLGSRIGFLAGWAILLDYFFLPMVAWLIQSIYLNAQFPAVPVWIWLIINIVLTTGINIVGIVLTDRVNKTLMALTLTGIVALATVCVHYLSTTSTGPPADAFWNSGTTVTAVVAGAAIAAYSFLGFDAVSTLSEETHQPQRSIPRAIVLIVVIGGLIFVTMSFLLQWVHPGGQFDNPEAAGYSIAALVGGTTFANVVNVIGITGGFASGLAIQASTSRLLYVMGRDGVLPRSFFGRLHPKLRTPVPNLLLIGVVAMIALTLNLDLALSFINFGAFLGFTLVNVSVIAYFIRHRHRSQRPSPLGYLLVPAVGAAVNVYLLSQLSSTAIYLGLGWLALGIMYLIVLTKGLRQPVPEFAMTDKPTQEPAPV